MSFNCETCWRNPKNAYIKRFVTFLDLIHPHLWALCSKSELYFSQLKNSTLYSIPKSCSHSTRSLERYKRISRNWSRSRCQFRRWRRLRCGSCSEGSRSSWWSRPSTKRELLFPAATDQEVYIWAWSTWQDWFRIPPRLCSERIALIAEKTLFCWNLISMHCQTFIQQPSLRSQNSGRYGHMWLEQVWQYVLLNSHNCDVDQNVKYVYWVPVSVLELLPLLHYSLSLLWKYR